MLSKEAEKKLQQIQDLLRQRDEINRKIEELLVPVTVPVLQPESVPEPAAPTKPIPQRKRRNRVTPDFTEAEIEKMVRESDEGKSAREIMQEYGFKSTNDWYQVKARYNKKKRKELSLGHVPHQDKDVPDYDDADDEEEPEDEPVVTRTETVTVGPKRYSYECNCGYSFKSTVPPKLIKCPDCMGKPKVVEEEQQGD